MIYHIVYIPVIYRLNMDEQKTTYRTTIDRPWGQFHYCSRSESIFQRNLYKMRNTQQKLSKLQKEFIGTYQEIGGFND